MEFTLYYRGQLKANRGPKDKQELRRHFHCQLKNLWEQIPLKDYKDFLNPKPKEGDISLIQEVRDFQFAPLISERLHLIAEMKIKMLRPEPPGSIVTQSGDIDNRLKTLLDALKMPKEPTAIPKGDKPTEDENPFFCLLEDDNLIVSLAVETDRLLEPCSTPSEVVLLIHVKTKTTKHIMANLGFD